MNSKILFINGSIGAGSGNTALVLNELEKYLKDRATISRLDLAEKSKLDIDQIQNADGYVFSSGVYWDSWGSPLQKFFEEMTFAEGSSTWLGKPAATVVTMHSVGGKEVLSRMQGVLCSLGLLIPPMSGMVYSLANQLALKSDEEDFADDLWCLDDLKIIGDNLVTAQKISRNDWRAWPVDRKDPRRLWLK